MLTGFTFSLSSLICARECLNFPGVKTVLSKAYIMYAPMITSHGSHAGRLKIVPCRNLVSAWLRAAARRETIKRNPFGTEIYSFRSSGYYCYSDGDGQSIGLGTCQIHRTSSARASYGPHVSPQEIQNGVESVGEIFLCERGALIFMRRTEEMIMVSASRT